MAISIEWLGTSTFRLRVAGLTIFLDAYMDRVPAAAPVGLRAADVDKADFLLVGHSHFDHLAGAEVIARNTGARIIGSNETCRVMREHDVPGAQLLPSQGGERHRLAAGVTARVLPSLHACTWILTDAASGDDERGHVGLTQDERAAQRGLNQRFAEVIGGGGDAAEIIRAHLGACAGSFSDGGALVYLIDTPDGTLFYQDTSGCWTGVLRDLRADVAILAASGRPNVDGEPHQGSMAGFLAMEASLLGARTVVLGHHDDWLPPITRPGFDLAPVRAALAAAAPHATLFEVPLGAGNGVNL